MAAKISTSTVSALREAVEASTANQESGIPGTTVVVVNRSGEEVFAHAAGKTGYGRQEDMTLDHIYWIASCTKMIVGIAVMQLVEKGVLQMDDVGFVEELCPELRAVKVLGDGGRLVEKTQGITLRMLLCHTAGFGYSFFNEELRDYNKPIGYDEFSGHIYDITQPLVRQPGEGWQYGVNIDWAGILLERATKTSLNDYLQKNIFEPLNLKNISMFPTKAMKEKLVDMNYRAPDGKLARNDHINRRALIVKTDEEVQSCLNSGGAGCFAKPQEYCQILAVLLNNGTSPTTGAQLLEKETVDEMFTNQIPSMPNFGRKPIPDAKPAWTNPIPELYPVGDKPQGWGLTFMLSGGATGRSDGTGHWAGLPNLWWWCDREKGVAGMIACQILPFADMQTLDLWVKVESTVYKALEVGSS